MKIFSRNTVPLLLAAVLFFVPALPAGAAGSVEEPAHTLMPVPRQIEFLKAEPFRITKAVRIRISGFRDGRLERSVKRFRTRLEGRLVFRLSDEAASGGGEIVVSAEGPGAVPPRLGEDESYSINADRNGVNLKAKTVTGILRGLETILQLVESAPEGFRVPAVKIEDAPRFPWRGLLIDVARHFQPVEVLKRNLDAMAAVKLNVFHWHLTEDQGFRVESRRFPRLHQLGSDGNYYTQEEIRDVIRYASDRGIRVVPEFDMPGHATSWLVAYPELGSAPGPYAIERRPGIFDPTLDPTRKSTYRFLEEFFAEMTKLFPDEYVHIGGDENEGKQWDANERIQAFMKKNGIKDNHQLQTYFNKRLLKILTKRGKKMMGWDEIFQPDLPKDVVIHSWRGQKALAEAARKGFNGVLSNGYYIDLMYPASSHYAVDPLPAGSDLSGDEKKRVLGGEATMWGEWVSPETIDSRIWPRTAAIAERLWSSQDVRSVEDMYRRLDAIELRLEELGLLHRKNQEMMLRRLRGSSDIRDLKTLVSLVEPVKQYRRYRLRPQTMLSPLTGLIDAACPDAKGARRFNDFVSSASKNGWRREDLSKLEKVFEGWASAGTRLKGIVGSSAGLREAEPLFSDLERLGEAGRAIVRQIGSGSAPPESWFREQSTLLDEIEKPKAALEFAVVKAMRQLLQGAKRGSQ